LLASLVIFAILVLEELQLADAKVWVLLSLKVPVATNCWVCKGEIDGFAGVKVMNRSPAGVYVHGW